MKVVLYMAASLNGYIARPDGNEDFLSHQNWETFVKLSQEAGNVIVGRKTYELVQSWSGGYNFSTVKSIQRIVVSKDSNFKVDKGFKLVSSPEAALKELKNSQITVALLSGGGELNSAFAAKGLISEVILNIEPIVIGTGRQIFSEGDFDLKLELLAVKQLPGSLVQLHYKVIS